MEKTLYPKAEFWDEFAHAINAPAIHFEDVPSLRGFSCPDESHMDRRDAPLFTRALAEEMKRSGVF